MIEMQLNHRKLFVYLIGVLIAGLLSACKHFPSSEKPKNNLALETINQLEESAAQTQASTDAIINSLLPPIHVQEMPPTEERFDVSVKNTDVRSFLLGLVNETPYNIIVSPEINAQISLQLKNVTISDVLLALERMYPLMVERKDNLFYISSAESMTAVYPVDYINLDRTGHSHTKVSGQIVSGQQENNNNQSNGNQTNGSSNLLQNNSSEISTKNSADFWKELKSSLSLIIQDEEKANVVVSPHAGVVIVKALPSTQRLIRDYLNITQSNLNRQVILEAKIIEVKLSEGFQAGIDWNKVNSVDSDSQLTINQQGQVLETAASDFPLNGIFSMIYNGNSFNSALDLLKTQGDVQVLSSPRVSTINNQKAIIKVGSDEFFVTEVSTTTVTGTSTATTPSVTLTPFFSGISLDVTPQINRQGEIILHIHPVVSEVEDQKKTLTLGSDQFSLPLALSNVRESDSIVRAKNNQIIVIGGLMQNSTETSKNSVPVLGDIPLLGKVFQQTRESVVKSELVILLKTTLIDNSSYSKDIQQIKDRFNQM